MKMEKLLHKECQEFNYYNNKLKTTIEFYVENFL